ncbi:hypothetical protein SBC1_72910 (plasmid) [Caballeronia sp. SBC1]|nr:hypothetical protein SBC1_72910 [Caballeronia sp. SBC1]
MQRIIIGSLVAICMLNARLQRFLGFTHPCLNKADNGLVAMLLELPQPSKKCASHKDLDICALQGGATGRKGKLTLHGDRWSDAWDHSANLVF